MYCLELFAAVLTIIRRPDVPRPVRALNLAAKLKDTANSAAPELSFQRKALQDFHSRQTKSAQPSQQHDSLPTSSTLNSHPPAPQSVDAASTSQNKRTFSAATIDSGTEDADSQSEQHLSPH